MFLSILKMITGAFIASTGIMLLGIPDFTECVKEEHAGMKLIIFILCDLLITVIILLISLGAGLLLKNLGVIL